MQGFIRRTDTLRRCIASLFSLLPPDFEGLPTEERVKDAEIVLQSFVFNLFGCADNLAWIWVEEAGVTRDGALPLPSTWVGLGSKCTTVRQSLSQELRDLLRARQDWFVHMETLRHALAHRIPLYIPRYAVTPENRAEYEMLDQQITEAVLTGNIERADQLKGRQDQLKFFRPVVTHSFTENAPIIALHPQTLADFNTVHEMGIAFLTALRALSSAQAAGKAG
jgi:hypothetical protein